MLKTAVSIAWVAALSRQIAAGAVLPRQDSSDTNPFKQVDYAFNVMQSKYYSGNTWNIPLQWQQAVMGTFDAATLTAYNEALQKYNGVPTNSGQLSIDQGQDFVETQYTDLVEYYTNGEQVEEIYNEAYDDVQWVVLEWLQAIRFVNSYTSYSGGSWHGTGDLPSFAHRAHQFYARVSDKFDTSQCDGGLTWNPTLATYKNTITNQLFVSTSVSMYLYFPGDNNTDPYSSPPPSGDQRPDLTPIGPQDPSFLDNAKKEYDWIMTHNFTNAQGLYTDGFHVSDGQTSCDVRDEMVYTYNQGVILSGMRGLWEATGNTTYLEDGYALIATVMTATGEGSSSTTDFAGLGRGGVMEDLCDASQNCDNDAQAFKGIYFHHLTLFCEALPTSTPLVPGKTFTADSATASRHQQQCQGYSSWVNKNAAAAEATRDSTGQFAGWWNPAAASETFSTSSAPQPAPLPADAEDYRNDPSILQQPLWIKRGSKAATKVRKSDKNKRAVTVKRATAQRTAQAQMMGLAVTRAAWQFLTQL